MRQIRTLTLGLTLFTLVVSTIFSAGCMGERASSSASSFDPIHPTARLTSNTFNFVEGVSSSGAMVLGADTSVVDLASSIRSFKSSDIRIVDGSGKLLWTVAIAYTASRGGEMPPDIDSITMKAAGHIYTVTQVEVQPAGLPGRGGVDKLSTFTRDGKVFLTTHVLYSMDFQDLFGEQVIEDKVPEAATSAELMRWLATQFYDVNNVS